MPTSGVWPAPTTFVPPTCAATCKILTAAASCGSTGSQSWPADQHRARGSRLDPFKPVIGALLQEDRGRRYAGRRTIQDIHSVLVNEYGMTGVSYSTLRD
jgi:hypothetical protein